VAGNSSFSEAILCFSAIGPLKAHEWQVDVAYRYLTTDQFYVGSELNNKAGPFGDAITPL
jgi:hypothetical protein